MKKQFIIALALAVSAFSFAQKKELKAVEKAIKGANFAEAKSGLKQVEGMLSGMDNKSKAQYYYLLAEALYANGTGSIEDITAAVKSLANASEGEAVNLLKQNMVNSLITTGNKAYEGKDYSTASKYFENAYRASTKDTLFLYYAAATSVNVQEYDRALVLYEELKGLGYTGIKTEYYATNKETNQEEVFQDKNMRDIQVKAKTHVAPGERKTESKKPEIVKNIALIYVSQGKDQEAIEAMKAARAESPNDVNLILSEANVHYKMGNTEAFKELLQKATAMDPANAELQYNLGVISAESGQNDEAKAYYEKALELDPNYVNAYINLSALILSGEESIINEMNNLGNSKKDNLRYDELLKARQDLYKKAVPYLSKALELDAKNISAAKTLMNIYSILGETDKQKELKALVDSIEAGN
ncbi:MAG: tetratricopeptide repeat protein [Aestuariibaculum sp.]